MRWIIFSVWVVAISLSQYLIKENVSKIPFSKEAYFDTVKHVALSWWVYVVLFLSALVFFSYTVALRYMPISVAGPVFTIIVAMITLLLGVIVYGESFHALKIVGFGLSIIGLAIMAIAGK